MKALSGKPSQLELWAGTECTLNRVGDVFYDQLERTGHILRLSDLDLFAGLGIRAIRYPILWERTAPDALDSADWTWADERMGRLQALGVRPIVGLVHHGNGPPHTSLLDPYFPEKLAAYARAVAERYPWVDGYTPINEPLTTARFCGLYGLWYPHGRDARTCIRLQLAQCRAVALAMREVRAVNPGAQLIQNEDIGKVYGTPRVAYQAEFENERRWLTFDLLCGQVDRNHPLWDYLTSNGASEQELEWFHQNPCPPDILGFDHYLTSERFQDEQVDRYPVTWHSGNGRDDYADVAAVDVRAEGLAGPRELIREMWERYHLPIAITEAHHGGTREEQLRWFQESWNNAQTLRARGIDVRAVTAWALLGLYDWHVLVTRIEGRYEPGVFDVRSPHPRPTAIAGMLRDLAAGRTPHHPLLDVPGWWHRPGRFIFGFSVSTSGQATPVDLPAFAFDHRKHPGIRPIAIVGSAGTLGQTFARACEQRGIPYCLLPRPAMDITNAEAVDLTLVRLRPWAVINVAGYSDVDGAEREPDLCRLINVTGAENVARACARHGAQLLSFSSDLVFGNNERTTYVESDAAAPRGAYGRSKLEAETRVASALPSALIVRTGPLFGGPAAQDFVSATRLTLAEGGVVLAPCDQMVSPTYVVDLAHACLDLLVDAESGIWHLANQGALTFAELACQVAKQIDAELRQIRACASADLGLTAPRPPFRALGSERGALLPALDDALARYLAKPLTASVSQPVLEPQAAPILPP